MVETRFLTSILCESASSKCASIRHRMVLKVRYGRNTIPYLHSVRICVIEMCIHPLPSGPAPGASVRGVMYVLGHRYIEESPPDIVVKIDLRIDVPGVRLEGCRVVPAFFSIHPLESGEPPSIGYLDPVIDAVKVNASRRVGPGGTTGKATDDRDSAAPENRGGHPLLREFVRRDLERVDPYVEGGNSLDG